MYFTHLTRLSWRSGATFLHDWFSLGLGLLVVGHVMFGALRSSGDEVDANRVGASSMGAARAWGVGE